ncbi:MAG: tRNA 4-thiouridine(8) synthase ThiI [Bacteriovoracales bacterium]|nr:tRNA 4-thiouridine(8) synthase ThiI [Bacteriovoracales bacterium]
MEKKIFPHTIIIHYSGELSIKGPGNFQQFVSRLMNRIRHNLQKRGVRFSLKQDFSRLMLFVDHREKSLGALSKIFGIGPYSPVEISTESELSSIISASQKMIPAICNKRFAVRARRTGETAFKTPEVERAVGAVLAPYGKVDLNRPEKTVYVETINRKTHLFCERIPGPGGLPLNGRDRCLTLFSGGFDSPVASWQMMKRGVACDYLFCNMGGKSHERQTVQVAKVLHDLWASGSKSHLMVVDFHPAIEAIKKLVSDPYRQVILKRVMYRVAEKAAAFLKSKAIITGESLGQVSSQSLQNIKVIDNACSFPVLRPLIGSNKEEIIRLAYKIGTGYLSEKIVELCGISRGQPATNAKYGRVLDWEKDLPKDLEETIWLSQKTISLDDVELGPLRGSYLLVDGFDPEAKIIDCRDLDEKKSWAVPNALHIPFEQLKRDYRTLDRDKKYIIYCTLGAKSPYIAELMQQSGREAYAFDGGIKKAQKTYEKSGLGIEGGFRIGS